MRFCRGIQDCEQSLNKTAVRETKYPVRARRASTLVRAAIVLVTMVAWFVATDHCALAGVLLRPLPAAPAQESCPGHSQPKKKPSQGELPCCKLLVATAAPVKTSAGYDSNLFVLQLYLADGFQLVIEPSAAPVLELDIGPPDVRTFAESVLQRSILAHAPPSSV